LRQRGDRADFHEAETQPQQRVRDLCVLVEARRDPDRIGKIEAKARTASSRASAAGRTSSM